MGVDAIYDLACFHVHSQRCEEQAAQLGDGEPTPSPLKPIKASSSGESCTHSILVGAEAQCVFCYQLILNRKSHVSFKYIFPEGLWLSRSQIFRFRIENGKKLFGQKKLCLLLDLDHTLLHGTELKDMTPDEKYLESQIDSRRQPQDVSKGSLFMTVNDTRLTKLRPFVREFLKEASQMFEMYIYTMGMRPYALEMAALLDPGREYFHHKIISCEDKGNQKRQKNLDVVLEQQSSVLILDDTLDVWKKYKRNLILIKKYKYFASLHRKRKSLSEQKVDESESKGALASILNVLREIHHVFFKESEENMDGRDVRQALKIVRKNTLRGCKIFFSGVSTSTASATATTCWKMTKRLGAIRSTEIDPSVTHVVSENALTEESLWALNNEKYLVHPKWIEAAYFTWQKPPEEKFPALNQVKDAYLFPIEKKENDSLEPHMEKILTVTSRSRLGRKLFYFLFKLFWSLTGLELS